jgi:L-proline amide hydrolase
VPHDYLLPLQRLASRRAVAFFDQPGCGRSAAPRRADAPALYSVAGHVALVGAAARQLAAEHPGAFGAGGFHLLGQSWGGVLALEYALAAAQAAASSSPPGDAPPLPLPASVVLANTPAAVPQLHEAVAALMAALPTDVAAAMKRHEAAGTTSDPEYAAAVSVFYARHQCQLQPRPACVEAAFAAGGSEWRGTGVIADWAAPSAAAMAPGGASPWPAAVRALLLSGEHDFVTPGCVAPLADAIPGATWRLLEGTSHMPHLEDPGAFDSALEEFWAAAEVARRRA